MQPINHEKVEQLLASYRGKPVYVHCEAIPGGFIRNVQVRPEQLKIKADRIALQLPNQGWIRMEGLTEYEVDTHGRLLFAGYDEAEKLKVVFEISEEPFDA